MAKRAILAVLATALWSTAAFAHHPFAAEFDMTKPLTLTGTVTKIEWQSPHVFAYVDAKDDQGKMANWKIELGNPAELTKAGWTRTSIKIGDSATFYGWRARNGSHLANAESVSIGDQKLVASSRFTRVRRISSPVPIPPTHRPPVRQARRAAVPLAHRNCPRPPVRWRSISCLAACRSPAASA